MNTEIQRWRGEIDAIDRELLELMSRRARAALQAAACKRAAGVPILDRQREREVLARVRAENRGPLSPEAVERLFTRIIHESRTLAGGASAHGPALAAGDA